MTLTDHHLLCLILLAEIHKAALSPYWNDAKEAIREAIASAESLGLPVSLAQFDRGEPIAKPTEGK